MKTFTLVWLASIAIAFGIGTIAATGVMSDRFGEFCGSVLTFTWGYVIVNVGLAIIVAAIAVALSAGP